MSPLRPFRSRAAVGALSALGALVLAAGCSSSSSSSSSATGGGSGGDPARALLPASIRSAGVLQAATDATYPPNEFAVNNGPLQGFDIDLAKAVAARLGLKINFADAKFDSIITGIAGGRYDLAFSSITDNKSREAKVDFVDYFTAGTSILVKKGNPSHITKLEDLCGKPVALEAGTVQVDIAKAAKCPAGDPIQVTPLPDDATARQQILVGRSIADMNDFPVAAYTAKTDGGGNNFEVVGSQYESAPYGVAVSKQITGLTQAVQKALQEVIADGTYAKILSTWNISAGSLTTATINGATS